MGDSDDFQPEVKSKKRKRSESKPKATQAGSITSFFNSTKTEKPVINLTDEKENTNNSENNIENEVRRSPRKRRRVEPSSNNDSTGLPSSSPATTQEVIFIADSQSQSQSKNSGQKTATPTKSKRGKNKQKEIIDESSNKENSAVPANVGPAKVDNTAEPAVTSGEGETIGRRLRPRSPVKTTDNQSATITATSPSKSQKTNSQIEVDSSDPPSTSASEDNFFSRMTKRNSTKSKKKEEAIPVAPKVDEVFAVKPGEKVHDFFLAASKKKEVKLQRELQKLDEEVASSRTLAQQITGDKKPHPFLLKNPAFKMTVVKEKSVSETTESVPFEGPTLRLIEFPFMSHVGVVTQAQNKMEDVIDSGNSNSGDLFSGDSQNEVAPNSPSPDPALFRDVLESCVKVRLSDVVVNPIKTPTKVEIKEDTPVTTADLEQFAKTNSFEAIVNLVDQQQIAFTSLELTVSQALNAANDASADEDSDSSQSNSSKKKEKIENINPKSHFIDPPTLEQDHIRLLLRTTMAKAIKQSNDAQVKANPLWTDKYAPTAVPEVCGNMVAVKFLSAWMSKWKTQKTKERKRKSKKDDDDEYMVEQLPNTVLLHGPSGVGKTAAVYACAKQIGLSVLELNPSAQRSAKEVAKYGEVTQSQAIRGQTKDASDAPKENTQSLNNFFKVQSRPQSKDKPAASEAQFDNTILLFEEVDIIDEEKDRGFYSALVELVKSTKRPIIVTCNTIPEELSALLNLPILQLKLRPMPKAHFLSYLKLVALCEGANFTMQPASHALEKFATFMKWDLRKSLVNLQFWLQQHNSDGMNSLVMNSDVDTPKSDSLRLFRNNLLESCFGYSHLAAKYSNLFWTFLLGQEIPQNGTNIRDSQQLASFFSFYYNKQRQKLMQSNNEDSPLFFSATIPKSEIQWRMEKEDTFFIAETAHLLRLDVVFNNYLNLFIEPVLPHQQALFIIKKTYEQIEVEEKIPILVLQDTPLTMEISENKLSDEPSDKQPEKKSPINSPKKANTILNFFTKVASTSPSKEVKPPTDQNVPLDPTPVQVPKVAVEEKRESEECVQQPVKVVVPPNSKVSPYKEEFIIEKRLEDKLVKAEISQANRLGELIFNDIIQLSDNISAADEMDSIQCPSFMSDKWPYDFHPRLSQSEMSSAYDILSLRTCVGNTCSQDWSVVLADHSTPSSGSPSEPLETFFNNRSVNLSTDDKTADQLHFQKKIDTVVGPLLDSLVFRLSKETCLEYTWFYQQLCFMDEEREKTNTKRRFTSILPKFRIYANECKMLKEMSLVKY